MFQCVCVYVYVRYHEFFMKNNDTEVSGKLQRGFKFWRHNKHTQSRVFELTCSTLVHSLYVIRIVMRNYNSLAISVLWLEQEMFILFSCSNVFIYIRNRIAIAQHKSACARVICVCRIYIYNIDRDRARYHVSVELIYNFFFCFGHKKPK